jgi:hypothetical protein
MVRTKKIGVILLGLLIAMASVPRLAKGVDVAPIVDQGWLLGGFS